MEWPCPVETKFVLGQLDVSSFPKENVFNFSSYYTELTLSLGLHVTIFSASSCVRFRSERQPFFYWVDLAIFSTSADVIFFYSSNPFLRLNSIYLCGMWTLLYLLLYDLLPPFTSITMILWRQVVRFPHKHVENILQRTHPHSFQCDLLFLWNHPQVLAGKNCNV